jgi:hypothetical protein
MNRLNGVGDIDLYGNDVYGLKKVINKLKDNNEKI